MRMSGEPLKQFSASIQGGRLDLGCKHPSKGYICFRRKGRARHVKQELIVRFLTRYGNVDFIDGMLQTIKLMLATRMGWEYRDGGFHLLSSKRKGK